MPFLPILTLPAGGGGGGSGVRGRQELFASSLELHKIIIQKLADYRNHLLERYLVEKMAYY